MKRITLLIACSVLAAPAAAHHGFGRFDRNSEIEVEGTLTRLDFVNPHSYVYFETTAPDGGVMEMGCEMRAATVLRRSGWSPELFVEGARIAITGNPHRDDPTSCYAETLTIGDAPTLERYQQLSDAPAERPDRPARLPNGRPNLAGDWAQEQYLMASLPTGGGALVPESMVAGVESGEIDPSAAPNSGWGARPVGLTAAGEAAAEMLRNEPPEENPRIACEITSVLFDWVFDGPINRISQAEDLITIEYGRGLTRRVHIAMDAHPAKVEPSRGGHSIGRWDGDTLVVDTVGFLPGRLAGNVPHSERLHVVERFTLDPERGALAREYVAEDPLYFTDEYAGEDTVLLADAPFAVDQCKELAYEYTTGAEEERQAPAP